MDAPSINIQWKGTDVCLDFHCICMSEEMGYSSHFDGRFAYYLRCNKCKRIYRLGTEVSITEISYENVLKEASEAAIQDVEYH